LPSIYETGNQFAGIVYRENRVYNMMLATCFRARLQKCLARPSSLLGAVMQGLIIKIMKELLKDYLMWKENKDDGYIYDEIHEFCSGASRSQLTDLFEQLEEIITKADKYDSLCK